MTRIDFLVTGSTGFLGHAVTERLTASGYSFITLGRAATGLSSRHLRFDADRSSLSDLPEMLAGLEPRWVLHLAGAPPASRPETAYRVNAGMLGQIIAALGVRVSRIVAIGTAAEYGETLMSNEPAAESAPCLPVGTYGLSKYAQTTVALAARRRGVPITIARTFNLVGPGVPDHLSLGRFVQQLRGEAGRTGTLRVGALEKRRDFVEVGAAATAIIGLATSAAEMPAVVNVCSGISTPLRDWLEGLIAATGFEVAVETDSSLRRSFDPDDVVGCNALLRACGFDIPAPAIDVVTQAIWRYGQDHAARTRAADLGREVLEVTGLAKLASAE